MEQLKF